MDREQTGVTNSENYLTDLQILIKLVFLLASFPVSLLELKLFLP